MSETLPPPPPTNPVYKSKAEMAPPPMLSRGKGWIADKTRADFDSLKHPSIRALLGATQSIPASFSLEQWVPKIWDQGQSSSCVGWALAQAIALRCAVVGTPIRMPSPTAIYTFARAKARANTSIPFTDDGSIPSYAFDGMTEWGVPSMEEWPFDPSTINHAPDFEELEEASAFKVTGYYRILSEGPQRLVDIKHAISEGYPIAFGTDVDDAFENYSGSGVVRAPDPAKIVGGHMMHLVGYTEDGRFRGINQWSTAWGDNGAYWADESFILSPSLGDIIALTCHATGR